MTANRDWVSNFKKKLPCSINPKHPEELSNKSDRSNYAHQQLLHCAHALEIVSQISRKVFDYDRKHGG